MTMPKTAPYGSWSSPIKADTLTANAAIFESILVDDVTHEIYHTELRPSEAGRSVLMRSRVSRDIVGREWDVRTGVQVYGGGAATVSNGVTYFSHYKDGRVYRVTEGKIPEPVTPENVRWRFSDFMVFVANPDILISVLEDHTEPHPASVVTKLVTIEVSTKTVETIVEGADFYAAPTVSLDGMKISWVQWHHPDMPWDGSELVVADIIVQSHSLGVENPKIISGHKGKVSVDQPQWSPSGTLLFLNDVSGFVNPWSYSPTSSHSAPLTVSPIAEDFSNPAWTFGHRDYAILDARTVLFASTRGGRSVLTLADLRSSTLTPVPASYAVISHVRTLSPQQAVFLANKDDQSYAIIQVEFNKSGQPTYTTVASSPGPSYPHEFISIPRPYMLSVPPASMPIHVIFFPPYNPSYVSPKGERPPAIFSVHGGPTYRATLGLDWGKQFWTTRGWAWIEINYGGSTGYGREYRDRLQGKWGIVDVNDTVATVKQLGDLGLIDTKRLAIRGASAGGFTALNCLITHPNVFCAGVSLYGISDLLKLAEGMHKFQRHYLERLLGGTPEEIPDTYKERSPITHASYIESPLLILQGSVDEVVPEGQSELIVKSIKEKKRRAEYILFEGEGHGWRIAENIKLGLEAELAFYEDVFGLVKLDEARR